MVLTAQNKLDAEPVTKTQFRRRKSKKSIPFFYFISIFIPHFPRFHRYLLRFSKHHITIVFKYDICIGETLFQLVCSGTSLILKRNF